MTRQRLSRLLAASWRIHYVGAIIVLLCNIPILWHHQLSALPHWLTDSRTAGLIIAVTFLSSLVCGAATILYYLLRLNYTRSLIHLLLWLLCWGLTLGAWLLMTLAADPPPLPTPHDKEPIQKTDILYPAADQLLGPSSLVINTRDTQAGTSTISLTPNLSLLESAHRDILSQYLSTAPRWSHIPQTPAFYTEPGHMMVCLPMQKNTLCVVHANFCSLENGSELPVDYVVVKPGDAMPEPRSPGEPMPDLAIDLGGRHYLQLAARGMPTAEDAKRALNAALSAIDNSMAELAQDPSPETIKRICEGQRELEGSTPELRVSEPPTQLGVYQAEVYCNPGEAGVLMLIISDMSTNNILRVFTCPARYGQNPDTLYRHDFPGDAVETLSPHSEASESSKAQAAAAEQTGQQTGQQTTPAATDGAPDANMPDSAEQPGHLQAQSPLFSIREGKAHDFFGATFEVWFLPHNTAHEKRLLLRRCYKVQTFPPGVIRKESAPPAPRKVAASLPEAQPAPSTSGSSWFPRTIDDVLNYYAREALKQRQQSADSSEPPATPADVQANGDSPATAANSAKSSADAPSSDNAQPAASATPADGTQSSGDAPSSDNAQPSSGGSQPEAAATPAEKPQTP